MPTSKPTHRTRRMVVAAACMLPLVPAWIASQHAVGTASAPATAGMPTRAVTVAKVAPASNPGHVYVANSTVKTISQYTAGAGGGLVALSPNPTVSTDPLIPGELVLNPSGQNLYISLIDVAGGGDRLGQYRVGSDGALTPLTPFTVPTAPGPVEIVATPDGRFLYVNNQTAGVISEYAIGPNGALSPITTGTPPVAETVVPIAGAGELTMSRSGKFLYAAGTSAISQFGIDPATGRLSALVPAFVAGGGTDMKITADEKFLYISGVGVGQYSIAAGGQLTPLSPPVADAALRTLELEIASSGKFLYATAITPAFKGEIVPFQVGTDGQLTALTAVFATTGTIASEAVISPDDKFLYAGDVNIVSPAVPDNIGQFSIDPTGNLNPLASPTVATGAGAGALAATPPTAIPVPPLGGSGPIPTTTRYTGPSTGLVAQPAPLSAKLTVAGTTMPIPAMPIHLVLNGKEGCTAITKADGTAGCSVMPSEKAGTYPVTAAFAGTGIYAASSASGTLLLHSTTSLVVTPSAVTTPPTTAPDPPVPPATTPLPLPIAPSLPVTGTSNHGELAGLAIGMLALAGVAMLRRTASGR